MSTTTQAVLDVKHCIQNKTNVARAAPQGVQLLQVG